MIHVLFGGIGRADGSRAEDSHINGHINVGDKLNGGSGDNGKATAHSVDQDPGEEHGEGDFDASICARCYEGVIAPCHSSVDKDLSTCISAGQ